MRCDTELFYEANKRKEERQTDLVVFVLSRSSKYLNDLIENTWRINNAKASIEHENLTRMEILRKSYSETYVDGCNMEWYVCARQVLQPNNIVLQDFRGNSELIYWIDLQLLLEGKNVKLASPKN